MKAITSEVSTLTFNEEDSILNEVIHQEVEIDLGRMTNHFALANKLTSGQKHVALIDADNLFYMDNSALQYFTNVQGEIGRLATAFYSKNLANRLTLLCLILTNRSTTPIMCFSNKVDALAWLNGSKQRAIH